ncbi:MAG: hypothetical protein ACREFX_13720 [Opitutaceae bacterium]
MSLRKAESAPRNPGPNWGYLLVTRVDAAVPRALSELLFAAGAWIAVAAMTGRRRHSRRYLSRALGRPAGLQDVWRHFFAFSQALVRKLRAADGRPFRCSVNPDSGEFSSLLAAGRPALLGTFHVGDADLLGFMLGQFHRRIFMVRLQVDNSPETRRLAGRFEHTVRFIWVNDRDNLVFALKEAMDSGGSVAMQCDRPEFSAKLEPFTFLGERRLFPMTIYHLALIFRRPVALCLGIPDGAATALVHASPVFEPDGSDKEANLDRARAHFQAFLGLVEAQLRRNPYLWFNFTPMNPLASESAPDPTSC